MKLDSSLGDKGKLPPQLSMLEYAAFIDGTASHRDPAIADRQKKIEKRITHPFTLFPNVRTSELFPNNP